MTHTPDKTRSVGETAVSARPVSEERLAELIGDVGAVADLVDGHWREVHSALRELQSLRASLRDAQDAFVTQSARLVQAEARIASLEKDAARYRWLRTAGAWESEIGMDELSKDPAKYDAAIDAASREKQT